MADNNGQDPSYVLFTDDSEESREAVRLMNETGVAFTELNEARDNANAEGRAPLLITPLGPYAGLQSIRAVTRSNLAVLARLGWQRRQADSY